MDQNNASGSSLKLSRSPRPVNGARGGSKNKQWVNGTRTPNTNTSVEEVRNGNGVKLSVFGDSRNGSPANRIFGNGTAVDDGNGTDSESGGAQANGHVKTWDEVRVQNFIKRVRSVNNVRILARKSS